MTNYVVLRRSPDWLSFDIDETREFCRVANCPEDMIVDFARNWDAANRLDFLHFRQAMKDIALASAHAVRDATVVTHHQLAQMTPDDDDLLFFTDDDDWVSADLFTVLRSYPPARDGWLWRSVFAGRLFFDTPYEKATGAFIQEREASDLVYTNNYAVTGSAWNRLGAARLLEHFNAKPALDAGDIDLDRCDHFLSAASKHLCCTTGIKWNSKWDGFQSDLPAAVRRVIADVEQVELSERTAWLAPMLKQYLFVHRHTLPIG